MPLILKLFDPSNGFECWLQGGFKGGKNTEIPVICCFFHGFSASTSNKQQLPAVHPFSSIVAIAATPSIRRARLALAKEVGRLKHQTMGFNDSTNYGNFLGKRRDLINKMVDMYSHCGGGSNMRIEHVAMLVVNMIYRMFGTQKVNTKPRFR
jgi:hypothetical protein